MGNTNPKTHKVTPTRPPSEAAPAAGKERVLRRQMANNPPQDVNYRSDRYESPPLRGKSHPPADMGFVVPASDDVRRVNHRDFTEFEVDPVAADAAADLAGELGAQFLEAALEGEEASDLAAEHEHGPGRMQLLLDDASDRMYEEVTDEELLDITNVPAPRIPRPRRP